MIAFIDKETRALLGKFVGLEVPGEGFVESGRALGRIESVGVFCYIGSEPYVLVYVRWFDSNGKPDSSCICHNIDTLVILEQSE